MIIAQVNGVDVSANLKNMNVTPGGDGINGTATLHFDQQAGGMDIRNMHQIQVWQTFSGSSGVAAKGRLFGGHVNIRETGNIATTKTWRLQCWDYNIALTKTVRDAGGAKAVHLTAASFANQILQLLQIVQYNGDVNPPTIAIDGASGVVDFYASMPDVIYPGGQTLGWYIAKLCITAKTFVPAIQPHFYLGPGTTFGIGDVFGPPVLWIYNGASLPGYVVDYSDSPGVGQKPILGTFSRVDDSTVLTQRQQSIWNDATVSTGFDSVSQGNYPNPYIVHFPASHNGYWMDPVFIDSQSDNLNQAQASVNQIVSAKANPKETFVWTTEERVLPGDVIRLTWSLDSILNQSYRVVKAEITIEDPEVIVSKLTINNRRLMLFDTGLEDTNGLPVEGGWSPPDPPGLPVLNSQTLDWPTGTIKPNFTIPASPSPNASQYLASMTCVGMTAWSEYVVDITNYTPTRGFLPGAAATIKVKAGNRANQWSDFGPTKSWTTATFPAVLGAPTSLAETFNIYDPELDQTYIGWSWVAPTDPNFLGISGYDVTFTQGNYSRHVVLGVVLAWMILALPGQSYTMTVAAIDGHGRVGIAATKNGTAQDTQAGILRNGSFEAADPQDPTMALYWARIVSHDAQSFLDNTVHNRGHQSMKLVHGTVSTLDQAGVTSRRFVYPTFQGRQVNASIFAKGNVGAETLTLQLVFLDEGMTPLSTSTQNFTVTTAFAEYTMNATLPTGTRYGYFTAAENDVLTSAKIIWVDDARIWGQGGTNSLEDLAVTAAKLATLNYISVTEAVKSAAFTADTSATVYICSAVSPFTATLPTAVGIAGRIYVFKSTSVIKITLATTSSQTIDGITTYPLIEKNQCVCVQSDGANWQILWQSGLILESDGTRWLGIEQLLPMASYLGTQPYSANTEAFACTTDGNYGWLITQYDISYFVYTTNSIANYWNLELRRLNAGSGTLSMVTPNTSSAAHDTWNHSTSTTFGNNPAVAGDVWIEINLTKTGAPGNIQVGPPRVTGRKIYT